VLKTKHILVPFSYVFHPIFSSIYGALFFFLFTSTFSHTLAFYVTFLQICVYMVVLPLLFYAILRTTKAIHSFTEASLQERKKPIFIQLVLFYALVDFGIVKQTFPELHLFFTGGFVSTFLVLAVTTFGYKASLHMIGIASLFQFVLMFSSYFNLDTTYTVAFLMICMGCVASSRLYLKSHTPLELIVGMLIGIVPQYLVWFYRI